MDADDLPEIHHPRESGDPEIKPRMHAGKRK
jgi:hypothetical protein